MLSRRFLRIKVLQKAYAFLQSGDSDMLKAEKQLLEDVDSLYELFVWHLSFWVELKRFAERRIDENREKNLPTYEDLHPNMKFVENRVVNMLEQNDSLIALEEKYKINWSEYREDFVRSCYNKLRETPEYQNYMNSSVSSFDDDKKLIFDIVDVYFADDDSLYDFYADRKLSFNSDYQLSVFLFWRFLHDMDSSFNEKTILPTVYKTEGEVVNDDKVFVVNLFRKMMQNAEGYKSIVEQNVANWNYDRLALIDKILIFMAMTEFEVFHDIPVKVTINEYIELSKHYSTPDSRRFINGMLDKIAQVMKEQGRLVKTGRGLV